METQKPNPLAMALFAKLHAFLRFANRIRMRVTRNDRPDGYPYPSGDSFRALADHIHEEGRDLDPSLVRAGDIVYVSNPRTLSYLKEVHPKIAYPYVLVQHNGDFSMDKEIADLMDDKIVRFYAQDVTHAHPKIVPIPIGIENPRLYTNGIPWVFAWLRRGAGQRPASARKNRILYRFSVHTNPGHRGPVLELFSQMPLMETFTEMLPPIMHMRKLSTYKFVASPRGNSIESCRTWEALYLRTVPILEDFVATRHFADIGLPVWVINDWKELQGLTEDDLSRKYDELMASARWDALHMDYWVNLIRKDQETARALAAAPSAR